jgi:hypothetical protein
MNKKCQLDSIETMSAGRAPLLSLSIEQRLRIFARRHISLKTKQRIKMLIAALIPSMNKPKQPQSAAASPVKSVALPYSPLTASGPTNSTLPTISPLEVSAAMPVSAKVLLKAGDLVRVRDRETIEGTLNQWRQSKGCAFMGEMWQYCGTVQRVMKRVQRFVDERDTLVHKASGIVLLENMVCQGTADYGPCDRSCFYFWREEWLEKIDDEQKKAEGGR